MELKPLLAQFGLSDKEVTTYLALVELGPSPVRSIAAHTKINRGSTYDALKALKEQGLVTFHDTESHQRFAGACFS
jgi:sugar-specific transcriptional regulator TrmB